MSRPIPETLTEMLDLAESLLREGKLREAALLLELAQVQNEIEELRLQLREQEFELGR